MQAEIRGLPRRERKDRVESAICTVGMEANAGRRIGGYSKGMRQRLGLAAALLGQPELLVLDEPTVGLDPVLRRDLWAGFHRLAETGTTLLVSSHVMDEADRCDRLLLMREGRITGLVEEGRDADAGRGGVHLRLGAPDATGRPSKAAARSRRCRADSGRRRR